jgi:hypothetical protein
MVYRSLRHRWPVLHTPQVCANGTWPMSSFLFIFLLFTTTIDLRLMGTCPDEDLISYVHVAHGLEVSSQTNRVPFDKKLNPVLSKRLRISMDLQDPFSEFLKLLIR